VPGQRRELIASRIMPAHDLQAIDDAVPHFLQRQLLLMSERSLYNIDHFSPLERAPHL